LHPNRAHRRKLLIASLIALVAICAAASLVLAVRPKGALADLYRYALEVRQGKPNPTVIYITTTSSTATVIRPTYSTSRKSSTVLIIRTADVAAVRRIVSSAKVGASNTMRAGSYVTTAQIHVWQVDNTLVTLCTGKWAADTAAANGFKLPADACLVTINEPPDWFSSRWYAVMHFLHLS
jgi:hypothetical protein